MVDYDGDALDEDEERGFGEEGMSTGVTEAVTKEVEVVQWDVKSAYISSYMLKNHSFLTQVFKENSKAQDNIFKQIFDFGAREEWRRGIIAMSSYISVKNRKHKECMLNTIPL